MSNGDLPNKPLVEAIVEARWRVGNRSEAPGAPGDAYSNLVAGRFFERVRERYPIYEPLPSSQIPDELVTHIVQHRFRTSEAGWPLVQIGPGVLTVNDTAAYEWSDFRHRSIEAMTAYYELYPVPESLELDALILRYIDAVRIGDATDVGAFLRSKLKVDVALPPQLFASDAIRRSAVGVNLAWTFDIERPHGQIALRFATGELSGDRALTWETAVQSTVATELPRMPDGFPAWLDSAHSLTHDWFFKLIEGELESEFRGA